jgi:hypothetical protein
MLSITQKELKNLVKIGAAKDITAAYFCQVEEIRHAAMAEVVAISRGMYGANGALLKSRKNGDLYAITARSSTLFQVL